MTNFPNEEFPYLFPICLICEGTENVRVHYFRAFPWICDECLPHVDAAEMLCAVIGRSYRSILGEPDE